MTRVFWDSMLFIYLFERDPLRWERVAFLRKRSLERGDEICTSYLAFGEILTGAYRDETGEAAHRIRDGIARASIRLLPFEERAAEHFAHIRAHQWTGSADSIHLACAAAHETDLFLTANKQLLKLRIPGIKFIADLNTDLF